jgi:hypothetical protein
MKDFDISEEFCEVLGGGLAIVLGIAVVDLGGCIDVVQLYKDAAKAGIGGLTVALVGSYLIGLLVDAVGLAIGEWWFDSLLSRGKAPTEAHRKKFWEKAQEPLVNYRDHQWVFYSAYRTLFLLFIPGIVILPSVVWKHVGPRWSLLSATVLIGLEVSLYISAKALLSLYYFLTMQFGE